MGQGRGIGDDGHIHARAEPRAAGAPESADAAGHGPAPAVHLPQGFGQLNISAGVPVCRQQGGTHHDVVLRPVHMAKVHGHHFLQNFKGVSALFAEADGKYPIDIYDNTVKLLRAGEHNEYEEYNDVYQSFGDIAKEEGFVNIAESFYKIAQIEKTHGDRFGMLAELLESNTLYSAQNEGVWVCLNCGHIHQGAQVPPKCPVCSHDKGYFLPADIAPYHKSKN